MSFNKSLSIKAELGEDIDDTVRKTAFKILRNVVLATPVDTGRAKGNWQLDTKNISAQLEILDKSGQSTLSKASAKLNQAINYPVIYIVNNLPYIEKLARGGSNQAPNGYIDTAIKRATNGG